MAKLGDDYGAVMDIADIPDAIEWQAAHATKAGSPGTGKIIRALLKILGGSTATGRRLANWQGMTLEDAVPLRIHGGLHHLVLTGADDRLARVYAGQITNQRAIDALVTELVETYDTRLLPWLDGPPQTNEAGRSASIVAGLLWLAKRLQPKAGADMELLEIGSSAGVNTMLDRYRFDLGGVMTGPIDSPIAIAPEWRGDAPPVADLRIAGVAGCDIAPIDLTDPNAALRLKSYVWPEAIERMGRIDAATAMAAEREPDVVREAADIFVARKLAEPQPEGRMRVLFHSIVWQYLPEKARAGITSAMAAAGATATPDRPLAWVMLETNRETFKHELRVRYWPPDKANGEDWNLLAEAHPHGAWVEWFGN